MLEIPEYCICYMIRQLKHAGIMSTCEVWDVYDIAKIGPVFRARDLELSDQGTVSYFVGLVDN